MSAFKAFNPGVQSWAIYIWLVNYEHGYIRRGLIGALFGALTPGFGVDKKMAIVPFVHAGLLIAWILLFMLLAWTILKAQDNPTRQFAAFLTAGVFLASPYLPTQALLTGYPDLVVHLLFLASILLIIRGHWFAALSAAIVAPFIHEGFLFLWAPVAILLFNPYSSWRRDLRKASVVFFLPIVAGLLAVMLHDQDALRRVVDHPGIDPSMRAALITYQFGQTALSAFATMRQFYEEEHLNFLRSLLYFCPPVLAVALLTMLAGGGDMRYRTAGALVVLASFVATVSILAFAWDLSRFLQWGVLSATIVGLVWQHQSPNHSVVKAASARMIGSAGLAFILAAFYFLSPVVYTYFAWGKALQFWVPVAFFDTPAGRTTAAFMNWYNEGWISRLPRELSCAMVASAHPERTRCAIMIDKGGNLTGPFQLIGPGDHRITIEFSQSDRCNNEKVSIALIANRWSPSVLASGWFSVARAAPLFIDFHISPLDAALSDFAVAIASPNSCTDISSVTRD